MADSIPIVFNVSAMQRYQIPFSGYASVWVNPDASAGSPKYASVYNTLTNNWALVLDRKDLTKPALFNATLTSNTDVPANLAAAVAKDSVLLFMFAGQIENAPQGALFTMLQENGAGDELQKLERYAYYHGCGMAGASAYCLVSVPGSGLQGIEKSALETYAMSVEKNNKYSAVTIYFNTLLSMVPGPNGYVPMEIG